MLGDQCENFRCPKSLVDLAAKYAAKIASLKIAAFREHSGDCHLGLESIISPINDKKTELSITAFTGISPNGFDAFRMLGDEGSPDDLYVYLGNIATFNTGTFQFRHPSFCEGELSALIFHEFIHVIDPRVGGFDGLNRKNYKYMTDPCEITAYTHQHYALFDYMRRQGKPREEALDRVGALVKKTTAEVDLDSDYLSRKIVGIIDHVYSDDWLV